MNEIKIYLKTSGRIAELYKDFDLYEGCYRNSQMSVYVPKSLLYENEDGTFANLVKTGAILTAPNGKKLTTKSYYLDYVKTETVVGIAYAVYTIITPKEFCVYAGTQTVVVNVESIDNTDKDNQKVISVTTTQTANLIVLESAYLGQDEPIEPTELDKIKATLTEIEGDITGLQSKVSDISDKVSTLSDVTTELMSDVDNLSIQVSDLSEDKLDKQSGATAYEEAYVKDTDGSQKMERVTITSIASAIVKRDANGNINIAKGLSGNPKNGANMENIADVEEKISKCPTLDGNNDFTGENTFEEAIQAKKGTVVKNSLDETNYNAGYISRNDWTYLFPADSGTFALTKDIPTDYATQTALANTQRQVDGLYTLLEQKNEIYVQTATDTYTTREAAGGENIADGVQTPVKKITGKTVKTTNQFAIENLNGGSGSAGNALSVSGAQITVTNYYACSTVKTFRQLVPNAHAGTYTIFFNLSTNGEFRESTANGAIAIVDAAGSLYLSSSSFTSGGAKSSTFTITEEKLDSVVYFYGIGQEGITVSWTNLMIVEGDVTSNPPSYSDYFSGLKNAFFKEIVSTGRNLIPYPYADGMSKAENGITFTVNTDGTITVNGTATARAQFFLYQNKEELMGMEKGKTCICSMNDSSTNLLIYADYYSNGEWKYPAFTSTGSNFVVPDSWEGVQLYILVESGETLSNLVLKPMLNYGSSALPYEPYIQSVLSLPEAVELTEYDTAYPETGEIQRQSNTLTFNGTETWNDLSDDTRYIYGINLPTPAVLAPYKGVICNLFPSSDVNGVYLTGIVDGTYKSLAAQFLKSSFPQFDSVTAWKAYLAAQSAAGNPLTVTYKTAEVQSTKQADFSADSYIAWKNGSETIKQGNTDNSIYGAENTVEQDYYLLTAPEEVTK